MEGRKAGVGAEEDDMELALAAGALESGSQGGGGGAADS